MIKDDNPNMRHMNFIDVVAAADLTCLREKEATYQGSWKKSGGRSAWFMLKRKIDRMIVMLGRPTPPEFYNDANVRDTIDAVVGIGTDLPGTKQATKEILEYLHRCASAEDIFAVIERQCEEERATSALNPVGGDGTLLAEVRDLRRYLTLVEAELMARGAVPHYQGPLKWESPPVEVLGEVVSTMRPQHEIRDERLREVGLARAASDITEGEPVKVLTRETYQEHVGERPAAVQPQARSAVDVLNAPGILEKMEDRLVPRYTNGHGTDERPPGASVMWYYTSGEMMRVRTPERTILFTARGLLEPSLTKPEHYQLELYAAGDKGAGGVLVRAALACYHRVADIYVLDIAKCPEQDRDQYDFVTYEKNAKEHSELPEWQKPLYYWIESATKYRIAPQHAAWSNE